MAENSKAVVGPLSVSQTIASAGTNSLSANIVSTGANFNFEVRANVCGGVANVRDKTLSAKIYLQGPALPNNDEEYLALELAGEVPITRRVAASFVHVSAEQVPLHAP